MRRTFLGLHVLAEVQGVVAKAGKCFKLRIRWVEDESVEGLVELRVASEDAA